MGGGCSSRQGRIVAGRTKAFEGMKIDLCIVGMAKCTEGRAKDNQPDALKGVEGGGKDATYKYILRDVAPVGALKIGSCSGLEDLCIYSRWEGRT